MTYTHLKLNATNSNSTIYETIKKNNCEIVYLYGYQILRNILYGKVILDSSKISTTGRYYFEFNISHPTEFEIKDDTSIITYGLYIGPGYSLKYKYKIVQLNVLLNLFNL